MAMRWPGPMALAMGFCIILLVFNFPLARARTGIDCLRFFVWAVLIFDSSQLEMFSDFNESVTLVLSPCRVYAWNEA